MKKPDAITEISPDSYKVWPLPCSDMIYCGPATTANFARMVSAPSEMLPLVTQCFWLWRELDLACERQRQGQSPAVSADLQSPYQIGGHGGNPLWVRSGENAMSAAESDSCAFTDIGHKLWPLQPVLLKFMSEETTFRFAISVQASIKHSLP